jgi:hypothetical protein
MHKAGTNAFVQIVQNNLKTDATSAYQSSGFWLRK